MRQAARMGAVWPPDINETLPPPSRPHPSFAPAQPRRYNPAWKAGRAVADIFDEIGQDLRAERNRRLAARYGWLVLLALILLAAGFGAWQWRQSHRAALSDKAATTFLAAARDVAGPSPGAAATPARTAAAAAFAKLAANAPESYRTLARLRLAALQTQTDPAAALNTWDAVAQDRGADKDLRDLANLLWAQHQVDSGDPAAVAARLRPLAEGAGRWRALAQETEAWLALRQGHDAQARTLLTGLTQDPEAPPGVAARARGLLGQLGGAPPP